MHSEHRHQLQQNELGQLTVKVIPWFEQHGMQLVVGIGVAFALLIGGMIWWNTAASADTDAWTRLSSATTLDEFGTVVDAHPGTLAAAWADLRIGELNLESGVEAMFRDRELGLKDLKASRESFEKVLSASVTLPDNLRERAMLGLARVMETTCDGNTAPVVEAYEKLLTRFPKSIYKPSVEQKITELKSGGASEFYAWFHKQTPKPAAFPRPQDGAAGSTPAFNPLDLPPSATDSGASKPPMTQETPAEPAPESETPKSEPAKTEAAPAEAPKSETPAADAAPGEAPKP